MNRLLIILVLFFIPFSGLFCQDSIDYQGDVSIIQDYKIDRLIEKHKKINEIDPGLEGYRVQIFFDSGNQSKIKAYEAYTGFVTRYPELGAYVVFQEPNYKVRAGNFRTRIEAEGFMYEILEFYPSAFVIKDEIKYPSPP